MFLDWDELDQDAALAWQSDKGATCPECGTRPDEWEEDEDAYTAHIDRCQGCRELAVRQADVPDGEKGIRVYLIPTRVAEYIYNERMQQESLRPRRAKPKEEPKFVTMGG